MFVLKRIVIVFLFAFACINVCRAADFSIEEYDIEMLIGRNRVVNVYEHIRTHFTLPSHGIYRDIPLKNSDITDININHPYKVSSDTGNMHIRIGSENATVIGNQDYNISFKHHLYGRSDEFYYNIIGTEWPAEIRKVRFKIVMPAPFDASKVGISIGQYGTEGFDGGAQFAVTDNIISGETLQTLPPYNGITVRIEVPQGYFLQTQNPYEKWVFIGIIIAGLLSFSIWFLYGRDPHITPVVTFYPPKDVLVREAEQVYNEKTTRKSLIAMLISLAQQGFLKINADKKDFSISKIKDYDGADSAAQRFMDALFSEYETTVKKDDLEKSPTFYKKCDKILKLINGRKTRFFSAASVSAVRKFFMLVLAVSSAFLTVFSLCHYRLDDNFVGVLILGFMVFLYGCNFLKAPLRLLFPTLFPFFMLLTVCYDLIKDIDQSNILQIIFGLIATVTCITCYIELPQLNFTGRMVKGQLLGLKKFIKVAEKKRLETLVEENPSCFYDILPYAYILGVSDKWINKFEDIMKLQPDWYMGRPLTLDGFNNFADTMQQVSMPSVENGGIRRSSGGGGGFVGGGHGGGGGGSW
ncbi:MAG: DUF2207 domain-containing protein [Alphaproteobacteria bacterium]|nr:DUF2207 domain-containing protein [Alphaproteobacteria bacterium]